jgi:hypothetical protein
MRLIRSVRQCGALLAMQDARDDTVSIQSVALVINNRNQQRMKVSLNIQILDDIVSVQIVFDHAKCSPIATNVVVRIAIIDRVIDEYVVVQVNLRALVLARIQR